MKLAAAIMIIIFLKTQISIIEGTKGPVAEKNYSPYSFIYLTAVFGTIFVIGPLLVPRGQNHETIRVGIMLSAFYMWLAWVTIYCSQIHPTYSLSFSNTTLAFLAYSWIHIGAENGTKCTISKNGRIKVRRICKMDWRQDTHLPFWIWFEKGEIVVKSGYGHPDFLEPSLAWADPEPFDVKYYGLRTKIGEVPFVLHVRDYKIEAYYEEDEYNMKLKTPFDELFEALHNLIALNK